MKYLLIILLLTGAACNTDFLNTRPLGEATSDDVWKDPALAEAYVNDIYNGLGNGGFPETMLSSASDETMFTHNYGMKNMVESTISPTDAEYINSRGAFQWGTMYLRIRACNNFFANISKLKFDKQLQAARLKGEVFFLRAWFYQQLVRNFGGVPLVDQVYTLSDPDYSVARNTFEECVNHIVKDCDSAAHYLHGTETVSVKGRATEGAALALKSRILLYAASDLHDMPTAKSKSATIAAATQPELLGYVSGDRAGRWQKALDAAKAVMDLGLYSLASPDPASAAEATTNYQAMFLKDNSESIFSRYFVNAKSEAGGQMGLYNGLNGYHNWSGNTPTQLLIDDYLMSDGTAFDWNNTAQKAHPYQNRDPRFYASILYDGANWRPRPTDVADMDPANQVQAGAYEVWDGTKAISNPGLDTRQGPVEDWNGSFTGYYMKKFIDPAVDAQYFRQEVPWPFFRYTEIILNYAEALMELGQEGAARTYLNMIRKRAAMPDITSSGAALKADYQHEREIEMVFEEQRYYDVRRWMTAQETIGRKLRGVNVQGKLKAGSKVTLYKYDLANYDYTYTPVTLVNENRLWLDKMYFMPIQRDEINRNSKLVQNPGF
ncbi:RagB/SusD family nutrient uptake outer membrane protein [Chitinophaga sancti]|uniref:RagB/SusD family nutrient uptake outer membrane protein n=1 Tax=Chitinophaga sancti TaxID=1004 RepID=A0A1K1SB98_9BACT|nr:RagB/SusD family nutrient uptake outer membrane protein [Chitinophaga sancti]WQD63541.1 RagB/SusD family nutrient uptake outer membrane protein [Chitinophaga sancti]WQG90833.1 RagB/SusD family nutrient uptake outer membrane protein [Chitinophaga sancti]SFW81641.1 Starch-binding associating with outer membrane [Chitinophaga sancti]